MRCCNNKNQDGALPRSGKKQGFWMGLVYGLIPHIGCIAFIVFTVLGVTAATTFFKPLLMNRYFFHILVGLSIVFATVSAFFYFKRQGFIAFSKSGGALEMDLLTSGIKRKWRYLLTLYGTTVGINLLLFMVIFPVVANLNSGLPLTVAISAAFGQGEELTLSGSGSLVTLQVNIPCPGHAPLIIGELKTISGVEAVNFKFPNSFDVSYNPEKTSKEQILSLEVFKTYEAIVLSEEIESKPNGIQPANNIKQPESVITAGSCCNGGSGGEDRGCGCGSR